MMSDFQRSAMHEFHKKISTKSQQTATAGSYLRKDWIWFDLYSSAL